MTDRSRPAPKPRHTSLDLTQTIRRLTGPASDLGETEDVEERHTALLVCRDADIRKWGRRWIERGGCDVAITDDPAECFKCARTIKPHVIVLEGGLSDRRGQPLARAFTDSQDIDAPVIVLSSGAKETAMALDADVFDVVRKPFEWKLLAKRAKHAARSGGLAAELSTARESLGEALDLAERARQELRSNESFEPLTGLPNKKKFVDLLKRGMQMLASRMPDEAFEHIAADPQQPPESRDAARAVLQQRRGGLH